MTTTPTNNPVPSDHPADARDNFQRIDEFVNSNGDTTSLTRTGRRLETLSGIIRTARESISSSGGVPLGNGVWGAGKQYTAYNQFLVFNGVPYKPKASTTLPYTTQGADPTVAPDSNNVQPFVEVSSIDVGNVQEETIGMGVSIYPEDIKTPASNTAPNNNVPSGTTHLRVTDGGKLEVLEIIGTASGVITAISTTSATIGGTSYPLKALNNEVTFDDMSDLISHSNFYSDETYLVKSFYDGWATDASRDFLPSGGGVFIFEPNRPKSQHNGLTIISPTVPFGESRAQNASWLAGTGETQPTGNGCLVRLFDGELNILWSGTTRVNTDDNQAAINKTIEISLTRELGVYVPKGDYRSSGRILFDLSTTPNRRMPEWRGDNPYSSTLRSSSTVSPSIAIFGSSAGPDHFQGKLTRIGFSTDTPNTGFSFGLDDLSDNLGNFTIDQCFFGNSNATSSQTAVSLRCNWMFDCEFRNVVVVGRSNAGIALDARQLHFCHFLNGSYSNARVGISFQDGGTAFSHGVTFTVPDIENVTIGVFCNQPSVRAVTLENPFIDIRDPVANDEPAGGAMFDWRNSDVSGLTVNNVDPARAYSFLYGGTPFTPQTNFSRVNVKGRYPNQTNPAFPNSDVAFFNNTGQTQRIEVFGGTVTDIFINGEARGNPNGPYTAILNSGEFIAVRYSATPAWRWKAIV